MRQSRKSNSVRAARSMRTGCPRSRGSLVFQYRFSINRDLHRVADDDAAFVHGVVPTDAKVLAVDGGCREEAGAGLWSLVDPVFPPGCLPLTEVANVEDSRSGDAANRQVARYLIVMLANQSHLLAA